LLEQTHVPTPTPNPLEDIKGKELVVFDKSTIFGKLLKYSFFQRLQMNPVLIYLYYYFTEAIYSDDKEFFEDFFYFVSMTYPKEVAIFNEFSPVVGALYIAKISLYIPGIIKFLIIRNLIIPCYLIKKFIGILVYQIEFFTTGKLIVQELQKFRTKNIILPLDSIKRVYFVKVLRISRTFLESRYVTLNGPDYDLKIVKPKELPFVNLTLLNKEDLIVYNKLNLTAKRRKRRIVIIKEISLFFLFIYLSYFFNRKLSKSNKQGFENIYHLLDILYKIIE
jgi:hypothetical protein